MIKEIVMWSGVRNANRRIYSHQAISRAINEYRRKISEGMAFGEVHRDYNDGVDIENASHLVTNLEHSSIGHVTAEIKFLDNGLGDKIAELYELGQIVFRCRGIGSMTGWVVDEYELVSIDAVPRHTAAALTQHLLR